MARQATLHAVPDQIRSVEDDDPVLPLFHQWNEVQAQLQSHDHRRDAITIPDWAVELLPRANWKACPELIEIGEYAAPGEPIRLRDLKKWNREHAWLGGRFGYPEIETERKRRDEAGRARLRWWIAEARRKKDFWETSAAKQFEEDEELILEAERNLLHLLVHTEATSLAGVLAKVRIAASYYREDDGDPFDEDADLSYSERLMISAAKNAARFT